MPKSNKNIDALLLIIILLWLNVMISLVMIWKFDYPFLLGISGLTISTILYFINKRISLYILALFLFLSIFDWVKFSNAFSFNIKSIFFNINILNLILFILLLAKNINYFLSGNDAKDHNEELEKQRSKVIFFKRQFRDLNQQELTEKLSQPSLVNEAKIAIEELLKEYNQNYID